LEDEHPQLSEVLTPIEGTKERERPFLLVAGVPDLERNWNLGSGMIRGIGPVYAKKLVCAFGEAVFDIIEEEPGRLREVIGICPKRAERIIAGWGEQKIIREIMLFLHSNGVGTSRGVRIYKTYGAEAIRLISENPYRLGRDIRGIGFCTADQIEKTALIRIRAGVSFALAEAMDDGHCGFPKWSSCR
jgi:exodeoxyribonuclease V alpha subunit